MTIRIAVIGAGIMGGDHARIFAEELPGAHVQVVCDASAPRARALADAVGAADVASDALAVIARADVDAVVIASPDPTHAPLSLAAIAAGKPVLCEKPLSQSSAECLAVVDAEITAGRRFIQLGFMRRFDQSYVEMKAARTDGSLGRALMMHNFHRTVETPAADFTGAMAITNSAPHEFDVVRHVLDTEGGFNRSSQHLQPRGVYGATRRMDEAIDREGCDALSWGALAPARSRASVLGTDCDGNHQREGSRSGWRVAGGRHSLVPASRRYALDDGETDLWPVSVIRRARRDRAAARTRCRGAGHRSSH